MAELPFHSFEEAVVKEISEYLIFVLESWDVNETTVEYISE